MSKIYLGTTVELEVGIKATKTGEPTDVDSNLIRILRPSGDLAEPSLSHTGAGQYEGTYDPEETGLHKVVFIGKGKVKVTGPATFRVHDPGVSID